MAISNKRFATALLIIGFISLIIWFFGENLGTFLNSSFSGIGFLVNLGEAFDSSTSVFFGVGLILIIAAVVFRVIGED